MKYLLFSLFAATCSLAKSEHVTLVAANEYNQLATSQTLTLNQGDSVKLVSFYNTANMRLLFTIHGQQFDLSPYKSVTSENREMANITVAGPGSLTMTLGGGGNSAGTGFATFEVTRAGLLSPPASIPQEADSAWQVILEQSSDLVNWTPANPGEYSGLEPKRFFRTRMVRKES